MGPIGAQEMIFIFLLALLLFGPKKLPELGRMLGKGLSEFRRAKNELKTTFESHMQELEKETRLADQSQTDHSYSSSSSYSSPSYPYPYDEYGQQGSAYGSSSGPYESAASGHNGTHESATASHDPDAYPTEPPVSSGPVSGTVPRSSSFHTAEPVGAAPEDTRPV